MAILADPPPPLADYSIPPLSSRCLNALFNDRVNREPQNQSC